MGVRRCRPEVDREQLGEEAAAAGAPPVTHRLRPLQGPAVEEAEAFRGAQGSGQDQGRGIRPVCCFRVGAFGSAWLFSGEDGILERSACMNISIRAAGFLFASLSETCMSLHQGDRRHMENAKLSQNQSRPNGAVAHATITAPERAGGSESYRNTNSGRGRDGQRCSLVNLSALPCLIAPAVNR